MDAGRRLNADRRRNGKMSPSAEIISKQLIDGR